MKEWIQMGLISGPPKKDIDYLVTPSGVFVWNDTSVFTGWVQLRDPAQICRYADTFDAVDTKIVWKPSKIPAELFAKILGTIQSGPDYEIGFILYWNAERDEWKADLPAEQVGTYWHVEFDSQLRTDGFLPLGSVHTHPNIGAFWSAGDLASHRGNLGLHFVISTTYKKVPLGIQQRRRPKRISAVKCTFFAPGAELEMQLGSVVEDGIDLNKRYRGDAVWLKRAAKRRPMC